MKKLQADWLFPISSEPIRNGVVVVDDHGKIVDVLTKDFPSETQKFDGILCPGFVNTHCHLELSYLKDAIAPHQKLHGFIRELGQKRFQFNEQEMIAAAQAADLEMFHNGIVAVGDICNSEVSLPVKQNSKLFYHHFVEIYGFEKESAEPSFLKAKKVYDSIGNTSAKSLVPHAPYSTHAALFELITKAINLDMPLTIHNQESLGETLMFRQKTGPILDFLTSLELNTKEWECPKTSSLKWHLPLLPSENNIILVHNTFTTEEDIAFAKSSVSNLYWCLCPKANLYIEEQLPNIAALMEQHCTITLGTDSLASNNELSILSEMRAIGAKHPEIPLQDLLTWATLNGARALKIEDWAGSFDIGKNPGIINICNANTAEGMALSDRTSCKRIV